MTNKEILITYVEEILYDTDSGNILHDIEDFYEVKGMVRLAYVYRIIDSFEKDEFIANLNAGIKYIKALKKQEEI